MHPVTRVSRVVQQLRSFGDLHASELEALAVELDAASLEELAAKVRAFASMQRDENHIVIDELQDVQEALRTATSAVEEDTGAPPQPEEAWKASPKRKQWLADRTRPRSRRELFGR